MTSVYMFLRQIRDIKYHNIVTNQGYFNNYNVYKYGVYLNWLILLQVLKRIIIKFVFKDCHTLGTINF